MHPSTGLVSALPGPVRKVAMAPAPAAPSPAEGRPSPAPAGVGQGIAPGTAGGGLGADRGQGHTRVFGDAQPPPAYDIHRPEVEQLCICSEMCLHKSGIFTRHGQISA